jgi:hypothetical protein
MEPTKDKIARMMRENTGCHPLDSGFDSGRHWQKNQQKDFEALPEVHVEYMQGEMEYWNVELYHYLPRILENDGTSEQLDAKMIECEVFQLPDIEDNWHDLVHAMEDAGHIMEWVRGPFNTYNEEEALTQVLQFVEVQVDETPYILLQIHGGADVRGGYTDFKAFRMDGAIDPLPEVNFILKDGTHLFSEGVRLYDVENCDEYTERIREEDVQDVFLDEALEDRAEEVLRMMHE